LITCRADISRQLPELSLIDTTIIDFFDYASHAAID